MMKTTEVPEALIMILCTGGFFLITFIVTISIAKIIGFFRNIKNDIKKLKEKVEDIDEN